MLTFKHLKYPIARLGFSPDGGTLVAACNEDAHLALCDTANQSVTTCDSFLEAGILSFAFSPNGKILAVSGLSGSHAVYSWPDLKYDPGELSMDRVVNSRLYYDFDDDSDEAEVDETSITDLVFVPGRKEAALAMAGSDLQIVFPRGDKVPIRVAVSEHSHLAWSPDGKMLAALDRELGKITLWRFKARLQPDLAIVQYDLPSPCASLAFSADNSTLAMGHLDGIILADVRRRTGSFSVLKGQLVGVNKIAAHPKELVLASASRDGTVRFWDMKTQRETKCFDWKIGPVSAVAFSPDGMRCAAGGNRGQIVVWDVD